MSAALAVSVKDLHKRYGSLEAACGVTFDVNRGEIFGLVGPDGAGKTTTFQILAGVMEPSSGEVSIFGQPAREARSQTGYLTQAFTLYPDLTVAENIRYVGDLRLVAPEQIAERGTRYLQMFGMDRFSNRLAAQLSGGMTKKLSLVCALVAEPRVLLLDEPTTGVDPVSRREFWDALAHLSAEGLTILVATPYLDEAERCNRVAFMHRGKIQQLGTPEALRASLHATRLELQASDLSAAERALTTDRGGQSGIIDVQRYGDHLDILVTDPEREKTIVKEATQAAGVAIFGLDVEEPTLENVFVAAMRAQGDQAPDIPFPRRRDRTNLRGQVAVSAKSLSKRFGAFTAVSNVSFDIHYGEIYGLLGANGAGKTTTIKMICGLLEPSSGEASLAGQRISRRSSTQRQQIGYMSQQFSLYNDLPIVENLEFYASVYGIREPERSEKIAWVLGFSGLEGKQHQITGSLPGGWKQRVAFGSAIMHEPAVLFLDEPTSGVDPLARRSIWRMINRVADAGAAVLVTTHYLDEAEQCNRLGLMVAGGLVVEGTPNEIKAQETGHLLEFLTDQPQRASDLLRTSAENWRASLFGNRLHVIVDGNVTESMRRLTELLAKNDIRVIEARETRFSLEDAFIGAVERSAARDENTAEVSV